MQIDKQFLNNERLLNKETLEALLFTLEICEKYLPPETNKEHFQRLNLIRNLLKNIAQQKEAIL